MVSLTEIFSYVPPVCESPTEVPDLPPGLTEAELVALSLPRAVNSTFVQEYAVKLCGLAQTDEKLLFWDTNGTSLLAKFQRNFACLLDAVFTPVKEEVPSRYFSLAKPRNWIRHLRFLRETETQVHYTAGFKERGIFVLKFSKGGHRETLTHESLAGLTVTNKLRSFLPNFSYVYTYSKGSTVVKDDSGSPISWGISHDSENVIVATERESGLFTVSDFVRDSTLEQFTSGIFQIVSALNLANKRHSFVHNNLSSDTVHFKIVPRFGLPVYNFTDLSLLGHLNTDIVARISGFEKSDFVISGTRFTPVPEQPPVEGNDLFALLVLLYGYALVYRNVEKTTLLSRFFEIFGILNPDGALAAGIRVAPIAVTHQQFVETFQDVFQPLVITVGATPPELFKLEPSSEITNCTFVSGIEVFPAIRNSLELLQTLEEVKRVPHWTSDEIAVFVGKLLLSFNINRYFLTRSVEILERLARDYNVQMLRPMPEFENLEQLKSYIYKLARSRKDSSFCTNFVESSRRILRYQDKHFDLAQTVQAYNQVKVQVNALRDALIDRIEELVASRYAPEAQELVDALAL